MYNKTIRVTIEAQARLTWGSVNTIIERLENKLPWEDLTEWEQALPKIEQAAHDLDHAAGLLLEAENIYRRQLG